MTMRLPLENIGTWDGHQSELARLVQLPADATADGEPATLLEWSLISPDGTRGNGGRIAQTPVAAGAVSLSARAAYAAIAVQYGVTPSAETLATLSDAPIYF